MLQQEQQVVGGSNNVTRPGAGHTPNTQQQTSCNVSTLWRLPLWPHARCHCCLRHVCGIAGKCRAPCTQLCLWHCPWGHCCAWRLQPILQVQTHNRGVSAGGPGLNEDDPAWPNNIAAMHLSICCTRWRRACRVC